MLDSLKAWDDLTKVNVDISAITGTPGVGGLHLLADGKEHAGLRQLSEGEGLFLLTAESAPGMTPVEQGSRALEALNFTDSSGVGTENVEILKEFRSRTGDHSVVQQIARGAPLVGGRYRVHTEGGSMYALTGRPVGDLGQRDPGPRPSTAPEDAIEIVRKLIEVPDDVEIPVEEVVFPVGGSAVWAFMAKVVLMEPLADLRLYLKMEDLEVLVQHNISAAQAPALTGQASIYEVNPLRTPNLRDVGLEAIGPQPEDVLTGALVDVQPRRPPRAQNAQRDFRGNPDAPGFDEANAYYHLSGALGYFRALLRDTLVNDPPFGPIHAIVRDFTQSDNAYFVPDSGQLLFGDFAGTRPSARSAEVVYHEFGHAISDGICRLGRSFIPNTQARGMSEGYSDYFACSALGDPRVGDYVANDPDGARNLAKPDLRFPPQYVGEEHSTGEVWGSILWSIREQAGPHIADALALESLQFLDPNGAFVVGLAALVTADRKIWPADGGQGQHETLINAEFDERRP